MANPTPVVITDINGNSLTVTNATSGTHLGAPTPAVLTDVNGNALVLGSGSGSGSGPSVVSSGLIGQFQMLASETVGALVDYSGSGNNATGTVGTAPSILSGSGGVQFNGNGAVSLPSALNSAETIMIFASFHSNDAPTQPLQSLIQGNNSTFTSGIGKICGIALHGGTAGLNDTWGNKTFGSRQVRSFLGSNSNIYANGTVGLFEGIGSITLAQSTNDLYYINGILQRTFQTNGASAGLQTAGNYQLGGCASGTGLQSIGTYLTGIVYYALFYNRVLSAQEIAQNHNAVATEMSNRGINLTNGGGVLQTTSAEDPNPQVYFRGDSITAGKYSPFWFDNLFPAGVNGAQLQLNNQGLSGDALASLGQPYTPYENDAVYRPAGSGNLAFVWLGVNDGTGAQARAGFLRQFCKERQVKGFNTILTTVTSNANEALAGSPTYENEYIRQNWKSWGASGISDIASLPNLGAIGAHSNTTYFPDGLHPSGVANQNLIAPLQQRLIDRTFGRNDWSSAVTASANSGPTFVQGIAINTGASGTTLSINFLADNQGGSTLFYSTDYSTTSLTITDSNNNTWTLLQTTRGGLIYYAQNVKPGPNTVNIVWSGTVVPRGVLTEWAGVSKTVSPIVAHATSGGSTGTSLSSGNLTTVTNGSLVIGMFMNVSGYNNYTAGGSFTAPTIPGSLQTQYIESQVQSSAGAIAATATLGTASYWDATGIGLAPDTGTTYQMFDGDVYLKVDPTTASITIVLPPAAGLTGQRVKIKNVQTTGSNTVTIVPTPLVITHVVANGSTAVFTVPNTYAYIVGQTIKVTGCTTSGLNATYTITAVGTTTITVVSAQSVTEDETGAQMICEFIDNAGSVVLANNTTLILESVLNTNTAVKGCNWTSVTD